MDPESNSRFPVMMSKRVVFPEPLGPITASLSPGLAENERFENRRRFPNDLVKAETVSIVLYSIGENSIRA
jgi:hypothetical protein